MANRFQYWTLRSRDTNQWSYFSGRYVSSFRYAERQQNISRSAWKEEMLAVHGKGGKNQIETFPANAVDVQR
eukprot:14321590-Ditylum_brightwellii.AAC.1